MLKTQKKHIWGIFNYPELFLYKSISLYAKILIPNKRGFDV